MKKVKIFIGVLIVMFICLTSYNYLSDDEVKTSNLKNIAVADKEENFSNGGLRYVLSEDAYVSGSGPKVTCGDIVYIDSCLGNICTYVKLERNGESLSIEGEVDRNFISETYNFSCSTSDYSNFEFINDKRYVHTKYESDYANLECGDSVHIVQCYKKDGKRYCDFDYKNGNEYGYGTVIDNYLGTEQPTYCDYGDENIRYIQGNDAYELGDGFSCGDSVHVTICYEENDTKYCKYDQIKRTDSDSFVNENGVVYRQILAYEVPVCNVLNTVYFYQDSDGVSSDGLECGNTKTVDVGVCKTSGEKGTKVATPDASRLTFEDKKFIGWAADDDGKDVNCSGDLVTSSEITLSTDVKYYACFETNDSTCSNSPRITDAVGENEVQVCYNNKDGNLTPVNSEYTDLISCASGYTLDDKVNVVSDTCKEDGVCYKKYKLTCKSSERPRITSIKNGIVNSGGTGTIEFSVTAKTGVKGYSASSYYRQPSTSSEELVYDSRGNYSISSEPGTVFVWGIDNSGIISYAAMASVIDNVNSSTTLKNLDIKTDDGETLEPEEFADSYVDETIGSSNYVRLSNKLVDDSKILASGFNPFKTAYKITTKSDSIAVYATLTSKDSHYVSGYEPRTVELDYGVNTILIKIQDKNGKVRTYTIVVTREDDRDSSSLLKNIKVSEGKLDFDPYTTEYIVSVGKNKKSVKIDGELASKDSDFVAGFGPRKVTLEEGITTALIKVQSEAGSVRAYSITFVKNGEEVTNDKDSLLSSLSLSNAYIAFEKNVYEYNTTVEYEIESLDIYALAENGGDSVTIYRVGNGNTEVIDSKNVSLNLGHNNIVIMVANSKGKTRKYSLNIYRKENGLGISSDTKLSLLDVDGYDIEFDPDKYNYVIKIKREKTLVIAATPQNNRSEIYIRGNDNLTGFSIVKIKVVAENGQSKEYTIDIQKDTFNKKIEMIGAISGVIIIICGIIIIRVKKKRKSINDYYAE